MAKEIKLLVIENDSFEKKIIKKALKHSFLEVKVDYVSNIDDADELCKKNEWDIILTDYNLPKKKGVEIIHFFKEKKMDVPIVVIADTYDKIISKALLDHGAHDFISKNLITPEGIGLVIRNALRTSCQQKETKKKLRDLKTITMKLQDANKLSGFDCHEYFVLIFFKCK